MSYVRILCLLFIVRLILVYWPRVSALSSSAPSLCCHLRFFIRQSVRLGTVGADLGLWGFDLGGIFESFVGFAGVFYISLLLRVSVSILFNIVVITILCHCPLKS